MANSLLDFVMSLVRDPDAAARYAADPAQAIADAQLTGVTSVDVNNLIPVMSESLSMTSPTSGLDSFGAEPAGNVWASGAATAAFDSFDAIGDQASAPAVIDTHSVIADTAEDFGGPADLESAADWADDLTSPQFDTPVVDDAVATGVELADDWSRPAAGDQPVDGPPGFDLFD